MAKVKFINSEDIDKELDWAGWMASVSYDSKGKLIPIAKHCISNNHGTPTRAMRFIFEISECSRSMSHEFVRHEIGVAKVQRSQRYVSEDGFGYVTPKALENKTYALRIPCRNVNGESKYNSMERFSYEDIMELLNRYYEAATNDGIKNEDARYVLPNATHTKLHVSFDWEGLKQFCYRRLCNRAQWEIREVAQEIKRLVTEANPFLGEQLGCHCDLHGYCPEKNGCGKAPSKEEFLECYIMGKSYLDSLKERGLLK